MENIKRIAIVLTAVISAATALTACGGSETGTAESTQKAEVTTAATTAAPAETTAAQTTAAAAKADEKPADAAEKPAAAASKDKPAKKGKSIAAKQLEKKPEPPAEPAAQSSEYVDAIKNTVWTGMDSDYNVYAMALTDQEIVFAADDGSKIEGYWGVVEGDPTIYIFSDADLTDCIASIPWTADVENNLLILNETVVLTPTEAQSFDEAATVMQQTATACKVAAYLDGTYWAGAASDNSCVDALSLEGGKLEFYELNSDATESSGSYNWSLDYNYLTLYDDNFTPLAYFGWDMAQDGSWLKIVINEGSEITLSQVSEADAGNIVAYLHSLLEGGAAQTTEEGAAEDTEGAEEEYEE